MTISRSRPRPDILIRDPEGYPIAVVEVKNIQNLSRDIAMELRHNLIEYGIPARVPYFLLLSQDVGFLWKETKHVDSPAPPNYEFPMGKVITRYGGFGTKTVWVYTRTGCLPVAQRSRYESGKRE